LPYIVEKIIPGSTVYVSGFSFKSNIKKNKQKLLFKITTFYNEVTYGLPGKHMPFAPGRRNNERKSKKI
jgi:hypothetical protein